MKKILGAIALTFLFLTSGPFQAQASEKKPWTIFIYLNADNNLEEYGYEDIVEMEKVGSNDDVNVVVQFDGVSPRGTQRYLIKKNENVVETPTFNWGRPEITSPVFEEMPEQDMGDIQTFTQFVEWGMEEFPADHYAVILWNHGSGWKKENEPTKGISFDDTSNNHITTNQLADGLDEIKSHTGNKIDLIAFDACLMAMVEIADSLSGLADILVASEETIPLDGYPYDEWLSKFYASTDKSAKNLATDMVTTYGKSYAGGSQGFNLKAMLSAIDLSQIELLKRRLNTFLFSVKNRSQLEKKDYLAAAHDAENYSDNDYRDLGHYVQNILNTLTSSTSKDQGVISAGLALLKAIEGTVIAKVASERYPNSQGISIYLPYGYQGEGWSYSPWTSDEETAKKYFDLKFSKTTLWTSHLDLLFPKQ